MKKHLLLILSSFLFGLSGCDLINPDEQLPSYVYIEEIEMQTNDDEGSDSHKLNTGWVFVNDNLFGTFELPVEVPILAEGETKISVAPGFSNNGISATRLLSPLHTIYSETIHLKALETDTLSPVTAYDDEVEFFLINDFESSNSFETEVQSAVFTTTSVDSLVFEGNRSGLIELDGNNTFFDFITIDDFVYSHSLDRSVFIEMNYKASHLFKVRFSGITTDSQLNLDILNINPREEWNKIYIDLSSLLSQSSPRLYRFGFKAELPEGETSARFLFDNIKLVVK